MSETFQRARRPEHKQQRYDSILAAARKLSLERGVRSVTLTDIAAEVGVHKSAVLRYFETREEIFLHLTAEGWQAWAAAVRTRLKDAPDDVGAALAEALVQLPLFCDLLAHASLNLERNVSVKAVRAFKLTALDALDDLIASVTQELPQLGRRGGRDLISATSQLAGAFWQAAHPPATSAELYEQDPRLAQSVVEFAPRITRLARVLVAGLVQQP